jgi:hypothetical protein
MMVFVRLRECGRKFQRKYESYIASRSLYGFSSVYSKAMEKLRRKEDS